MHALHIRRNAWRYAGVNSINGQYFIFTYEYTANVTVTATNVTVKVDKVETSRVRVSGR